MSEPWRNKTYYNKRVLIGTNRVLNPQYDDTLLCLTGAQLEMLRNLTQYLHRRSSFVSEYQDMYYLAPSNAEWDELQAIVADLEEKLMSCEEFTTLLQSMLVQLQCICDKAARIPEVTPGITPVVEDYLGTGELQPEDDYGGDTVLEAKRCAIAQLTFAESWEWVTEFLQPLAENTVDVLMPAVMVSLATIIGTSVLGIPVGILLALLWMLIEIDIDGSIANVQNELWSNKHALVCAVWSGLATDYNAAKVAAWNVIDGMSSLSVLDKGMLKITYEPWAIGLAAKAEANATAWAVANVVSGYCDDCLWWFELIYTFPPCPNTFTGSFVCTQSGRLGMNQSKMYAYSPTFELPSILENVDLEIECSWKSANGWGYTVGGCHIQVQLGDLSWVTQTNLALTNLHDAGEINTADVKDEDETIARNVLRIRFDSQLLPLQEDPYPLEPMRVRVTIYPHV